MTHINNIYFNYIKLFNIIQEKGRKIMNDEVRKQRKEIWHRMNDNSELEWSSSSLRFFCRDNKAVRHLCLHPRCRYPEKVCRRACCKV